MVHYFFYFKELNSGRIHTIKIHFGKTNVLKDLPGMTFRLNSSLRIMTLPLKVGLATNTGAVVPANIPPMALRAQVEPPVAIRSELRTQNLI